MFKILPIELIRIIYDYIQPIREYQEFRKLTCYRHQLLNDLDSRQTVLSEWCISDCNRALAKSYFEIARDKLEEVQTILDKVETINQHIESFYLKNPKFRRPDKTSELNEHQFRLYQQAWISEIAITRMDRNISTRRGLVSGSGDDLIILYDELVYIMKKGTCKDLIHHCDINRVNVPHHLRVVSSDQSTVSQIRGVLVNIVMSF